MALSITTLGNIIRHKAGLTREVSTELSDVIYERALVTQKFKDRDQENEVYADRRQHGNRLGSPVSHWIIFKGENTGYEFRIDNSFMYGSFQEGERIRLGYREVFNAIYDYAPPNFEKKQMVDKELINYRFESADPIQSLDDLQHA